MEEQGTLLMVGQKFDLFGGDKHIGTEGAYFEAIEDHGGYIMAIYLNHMKASEKRELRQGIIQVKVIKEGNYILFLSMYGASPLIFETSFDPTLYDDDRALQLLFHNHMVTFIGIESTNNTIQTLRTANMPQRLK